jgi:hypothetical protein
MATLKNLLESIHESTETSSDASLAWAVKKIVRVQGMSGAERDTIRAAYRDGPLEDGDVPSKAARDALVAEGMMAKIVVKGEQGYNACTYLGALAYRLISAGA